MNNAGAQGFVLGDGRAARRLSQGNEQRILAAQQVIDHRTMQMALGTMKPEEATRMVLEKPAAFMKAFEMAARSNAASRGHAATALAALKPIGEKTASNAKRLGRTKSRA